MPTDPSVQRLTTRFRHKVLTARTKGFKPTLARADRVMSRVEEWGKQFSGVLRQAKTENEGAPNGWVWQTPFISYFKGFDVYQSQLRDLDYTMEGLAISSDPFADQAAEARNATKGPGRVGRISHAISDLDFAYDPVAGDERLLYRVATLEGWHRAFMKWVSNSKARLKRLK